VLPNLTAASGGVLNPAANKTIFNFVCLPLLLLLSCTTPGSVDWADISARGAIGQVAETVSGPLYEGDGGAGISLAVLTPEVLGEAPSYLPVYVQGILNNNFRKYSRITLIDRQNLEQIIKEQDLAAGGRFSESDFVSIGNLTNARYILIGTIQQLSGNLYSLKLTVTEAASGEVRASFIGNGTLARIEGRGTLLNEAAADLLTQLGVNLTESGRRSLAVGNSAVVQAETGLARGIAAQAGGDSLGALLNYTQSAAFDPSGIEALTRLSQLSSLISEGSISERIVNDFQARDRWLEAFRETARFFNEHPPFEITFDPNLAQEGESDYKKRTVNLAMRVELESSGAGFEALNALLAGLDETGRRTVWGFSGWPLGKLEPPTAGTMLFDGKRALSFKMTVTLLNDTGKSVGRGNVTLDTGKIQFAPDNKKVLPPDGALGMVRFNNVKIDNITPVLTIVINDLNGIRSGILSDSGYMKIAAGALEERWGQATAAAAYFDRGNAYSEKKDYEEAIANYNKAIKLDPNNDLVYNSRGNANYFKGDYDRAIADYNKAIKLDPNNDVWYNNRGWAYYRKGDYDRAIADYNKAIKLDPDYAAAYNDRGWAYDDKGDHDRAIADYDQAIKLDPDYTHAYNNRGWAYYNKDDYDRAITDYDQAIKLDPDYIYAYNNRGLAYDKKGDHDRAIADYDQVIKLDPDYTYAYNNRGLAYDDKGDYDRAIAEYDQAIKLDPDYANAYNNRGWVYYKKGDYNRAIADYEAALRIDPKHSYAKNNLKTARRARGY
jgi:tetratricopeptide (TPR) repeat protein